MFADEQMNRLTESVAEFESSTPAQQKRVQGLIECAVKALEKVKADEAHG